MKSKIFLTLLLIFVFTSGCHHGVRISPLPGTPNWQPDPGHAGELQNEEVHGNGIEVGVPKTYDDASLRMMLDAIRAKLGAMTGLNQDALISRLGSTNGSTINQTQFGFQLTGGGPSVTTTNTGATNSVTTNANLPQGNTSVPGTVTVTTDPTQSTVTTSATPPVPSVASGIAFAPPSSVSPSSLDVLNEQMQLSYEMANLELLLEGALSDRFVTNQRFVKPRVTLGFPISLRTPPQFRDAIAVVEVEVTTSSQNLADPSVPEPPAITALLPREKTYNVAAMTDNMTSIGGGVVIGSIGIAASYLKGHKTLYVVQDQDTIAMQRPPGANPNSTSFLWEFRPVLGQHFVRGGLKQTFVQLALPILENKDCFGTIRIRTYWRNFDQKNGLGREVIPGSVLISSRTFPIPRYDLAPTVNAIDYQDLSDGTVSVAVQGNYLAGTYIQLGPTRFEAGKNLIVEDTSLKFTAPISALAQWTGHIIARNGAAADLLNPLAQRRLPMLHQTACVDPPSGPLPPLPPPACPEALTITGVSVQPLNESESAVRVEVATPAQSSNKLLLAIGSKVFGLKDAPLRRYPTPSGVVITATVSTASLVSSPKVRIFLPFWSDVDGNGLHCYDSSYSLTNHFGLDSATERLVLVSVDTEGNTVYLLYGNDLTNAKLLVPDHDAMLEALDNVTQDRLRVLKIKKAVLQTIKKIVLQKENGQRPLLLDLPDAKPVLPKVSVDSPVIQNTSELTISAEQAPDVISIKFEDKALQWKLADKSTIRLLNVRAAGVTNEQKTREITVEYKNGLKVPLKIEVVAARIGVK
jgi:hypothetical protein